MRPEGPSHQRPSTKFMRSKILIFAVVGLLVFLTGCIWQLDRLNSEEHLQGIRSSSQAFFQSRSDSRRDKGRSRKFGLPQKLGESTFIYQEGAKTAPLRLEGSGAPRQRAAIPQSAQRVFPGASHLSEPAIILFCYDRSVLPSKARLQIAARCTKFGSCEAYFCA